MTTNPYIRLVDPQRLWEPMPIGRALAWTGLFLRRVPLWPGATGIWVTQSALKEGRPAGIAEWAEHARRAEEAGFSPALYAALQDSLDGLRPEDFASHPDNDLDRRSPVRPVRRFDPGFWAPWPGLVADGASEDEATGLVLTIADAAAGSPPSSL